MNTALLRTDNGSEPQALDASRSDILARYRRLREISKRHHTGAMAFLSRDAILQQARRLGLADGRTLLLDSEDELTLVFDLAIHTAPAGRSRAIDRYARSARFPHGSDEAVVLQAMCGAQFAIIVVRDRHPVAGVLVTDIIRKTDLWLLDEGLERSFTEDMMLATRYYQPAEFTVTAGIIVPVDLDLLEAAGAMVPQLGRMSEFDWIADRRFAEAVYRIAIAGGMMEGVSYQDPGGDAA